jgi:hypothetical protein
MKVETYEQDGFKLVRTLEPIAAGDMVMRLSLDGARSTPTRTSIRVGPGVHAEDLVGSCINHSCTPSCAVMGEYLVALFDLPAGAEVTFDYTENEEALAAPFICLECGVLVTGAPRPCQKKW